MALTGCLLLLGLTMAPAAQAFTEPRTYFDDPSAGGGGGRWFTGSPAEGYGCDVCHTGNGSVDLQITGLPEVGYVPGQQYDVRISWPEFAERAAEIRKDGEDPASMGMVAEFVSETGIGAGSIAIAPPADAAKAELCVLPEGAPGTQLYQVRPGEDVVEEPTRCEATTLGQRCVMAVLSCGARELRFSWTAPDEWQGPIWFSAGFVGTERVSGDPSQDAVTLIQQPLLPAASRSEFYESTLHSGCAVVAGPARQAGGPLWAVLAMALGLRLRGRGRGSRS